MISGLYTLPGFCDTAMAAACANLLLGPTMKRSNVYPSISGISISVIIKSALSSNVLFFFAVVR